MKNIQSQAISLNHFRISSKGYVIECIDNGVLKGIMVITGGLLRIYSYP